MVIIGTILTSLLTSFFTPIGFSGSSTEGSSRFGLVVEDPRDMLDEENQVGHWQFCP